MLSCKRVLAAADLDTRKRSVDCATRNATIVARLDISRRCAGNVGYNVPRAVEARAVAKATRAAATTAKWYNCGQLGHRRVAVAVANVDI